MKYVLVKKIARANAHKKRLKNDGTSEQFSFCQCLTRILHTNMRNIYDRFVFNDDVVLHIIRRPVHFQWLFTTSDQM